MLEELKRPELEVFNRDFYSIRKEILSKYVPEGEDEDIITNYERAKYLVEEAFADDEALKDLLTILNFSLDPWNNQIFYDFHAHKILIYDDVNEEFIFTDEDFIAIISADC